MTSADDKAFGKGFDSDSDSVDVGLGVCTFKICIA